MHVRMAGLSMGLLALILCLHAPAEEAEDLEDAAAYRQRIAEGALKLIGERTLYQEQVANESLEESLTRMLHEPRLFDPLASVRIRGFGDMSQTMNDPRVARVFGELAEADRATRTAMLERTLTELSSFLDTVEAWFEGGKRDPLSNFSGYRLFPRLLLHIDDEGRSLSSLIRWYDFDKRIEDNHSITQMTGPLTVAIDTMSRRRAGETAATPSVKAFGPRPLMWAECVGFQPGPITWTDSEEIVDAARLTMKQ